MSGQSRIVHFDDGLFGELCQSTYPCARPDSVELRSAVAARVLFPIRPQPHTPYQNPNFMITLKDVTLRRGAKVLLSRRPDTPD